MFSRRCHLLHSANHTTMKYLPTAFLALLAATAVVASPLDNVALEQRGYGCSGCLSHPVLCIKGDVLIHQGDCYYCCPETK
ncbi:hypothetical protein JOM56_002843 [Amanita muscaria]